MASTVLDVILHCQRKIEKYPDEERLSHYLGRLNRMPVTVQHLQETGVGRTVNALRKYQGSVGEEARALVNKWKAMVAAEEEEEKHEEEAEEEEEEADSDTGQVVEEEDDEEERRREKREEERRRAKREEEERRSNGRRIKREEVSREEEERKERKQRREAAKEPSPSSHHQQHHHHHHHHHKNRNDEEEEDEEESRRRERHRKEKVHRKGDKQNDSEEVPHSNGCVSNGERSSSERSHHKRKMEAMEKDENRKKQRHREREKEDERTYVSKVCEDSPRANVKDKSVTKERELHRSGQKTEPMVEVKLEKGVKDRRQQHHQQKEETREKTEDKKSEQQQRKSPSKEGPSSSNAGRAEEEGTRSGKKKKKKKPTPVPDETGAIDFTSGASFADALGFSDISPPVLKKKSGPSATFLPVASSSASPSSSAVSPRKKKREEEKERKKRRREEAMAENDELEKQSLEERKSSSVVPQQPSPLDLYLESTLPEISPNYKPLPHYHSPTEAEPQRRRKTLTEEEALSAAMSNKNARTKVFSGAKSVGLSQVPSLYEVCIRVLQENIDGIEDTGGVPYTILKPVLERATPTQLFTVEHFNPYLVQDTDELWKYHCQKSFRNKQREEMETWRETFLRCHDEQEARLKALTANIQQSMAKATPTRQTKLAYVDSVAKPPRSVAKQQARYGTASSLKAGAAAARGVMVNRPGSSLASTPSSSGSSAIQPVKIAPTPVLKKPKVAPLMQKTLKFMKNRFRR